MRAAWLWARNEIHRGSGSLLVVALLIALTGGAVMAGVAGARRAGDSVHRFLADTGLSDVSISTQGTPLDPTLLEQLTNDPRIERTAVLQVVLATPSTLRPGQDGSTIVMPPEYWGDVVRPRLVRGRYPSASDEIAMTEQEADLGFEVGQSVDMVLLTAAGFEGCVQTGVCTPEQAGSATITGELRFPSDLAPGPFDQGMFIAPPAFLDGPGSAAATAVYITDLFTVDAASADAIVADGSASITGGTVARADSDVGAATDAARLQCNALLIGSVIAALAGLLIAGQAYVRFLTRRTSDATTLSALGMPRDARTTAAWLPGLAAGGAGAVGAVPIAIALSPLFPLQMARRADPDAGVHADVTVLIVGAFIVFLIVAASAWASARSWSRTASVAMSTNDVSRITKLARDLRLAPAPTIGSGFALERGLGERRAPVIPALAGAVAAIGVIVGALVLSSSLDGLLSSPARYGAAWNLQVSVGDQADAVARQIATDGRVDASALAVSGGLDVSSVGGQPLQVYSIGFQQRSGSIDPVILAGRPVRGPDDILLGSRTLADLGAHVGDEVTVGGPGGQRTMTVVGRAIVPIVGRASTDTGAVVALAALRDLGGDQTGQGSETQILVRAADPAAFRTDLEDAGTAVDGTFRQSNVSILDEIRGVPFYVATFTAIIGSLAVFHALAVTGRRRRRDLAVLRALGHRPGQTRQVIRWQAFVVTAVALVIGTPLGIIGGRILWRAIAGHAGVLVVTDTPLAAIAAVAALALVSATVALATGPAIAAGRRPPSVDLKTE
jgi:ABC-type lipoprotein release transport system permease subunit